MQSVIELRGCKNPGAVEPKLPGQKILGRFMETLDHSKRRVLAIWWLLLWRSLVFGFLGGFAVGFMIGLVLGLLRVSPHTIDAISSIAGFCVGLAVSFLVLRSALRKRFRDFRIVLVGLDSTQTLTHKAE
jgi:ABC-type uncharacterized transport system permease subunit